ncbi:MAG: protein translocase subunit SecF [Candidatus Poribacteria bacterium]|nr:protein translocase subunit SecF [Candidatus Poribacteria bacterium]
MELIKNTHIDFLTKRRTGFLLSAVLIIIGLVSLTLHQGPNFGIDFRGGVKIHAKFNRVVTEGELKSKLTQLGYDRIKIQVDAARQEASVDIGYSKTFESQRSVGRILSDALLEGDAGWHAVSGGVSVNGVGPSVGKDLKWAALWSVLWSIVILLLYISWRFEFRFAIGAIVALIHDVLITLGVFSVFEKEINLPTVAAFLTIIGYSLNDTIVVFDRIRENANFLKGVSYAEIINKSINQSLSRTVITSLTTFFVVLTIFVLTGSGSEINTFALALIVGVIVGTYSSIFIASPIIHIWHLKTQQRAA